MMPTIISENFGYFGQDEDFCQDEYFGANGYFCQDEDFGKDGYFGDDEYNTLE